MKAVVATFNKEKALVGAFSVIVKTSWIFVSSSSPGRIIYRETIDISVPGSPG